VNLFVSWECQILTFPCFCFTSILAFLIPPFDFTYTYKLCSHVAFITENWIFFLLFLLASSETYGTSGSARLDICGLSIWCVVNGAGRHNFSYDMVVHF
jgi:hypothetical protein